MKIAFVRKLHETENEYRTLGLFFVDELDDLGHCIDESEDPSDCEYLLLENFRGAIYLEEIYSELMEEKWLDFMRVDKEPDVDEIEYSPLSEVKYIGRSEMIFNSIADALQKDGWKPLYEDKTE